MDGPIESQSFYNGSEALPTSLSLRGWSRLTGVKTLISYCSLNLSGRRINNLQSTFVARLELPWLQPQGPLDFWPLVFWMQKCSIDTQQPLLYRHAHFMIITSSWSFTNCRLRAFRGVRLSYFTIRGFLIYLPNICNSYRTLQLPKVFFNPNPSIYYFKI